MADLMPYEPNRGKKTFGGNISKDGKHKCYLSPLAYFPQRGMRLRENAPLAKHQRD